MTRAWLLPMVFFVCGCAVATGSFRSGHIAEGATIAAAFTLLAYLNSPLIFPRSLGAREAQRRSALDGRPVVFWRPGCAYCLRLRFRLGHRARQLHWVDIWRDPEGAAVVRAANDGNETVPTVVVAGTPHTNPDPAWVRDQLAPSARRDRNAGG
ncbi:glutaredoxin domain-containing protein [Streptomyces castrisilvae]|uniref:Glutaredoxin domain-containing protein n=1 Tax=Streptomyces castrisilvae TaxID=3033811 RepID=A0ABY9HWV5_9ACTN|nr:glutaredoxin domain-containing protein [Streptomyces sp. Mut1]WLQ37936.1 glutaredoxin domain-containing protein [Streptomyces sp. Mut1]